MGRQDAIVVGAGIAGLAMARALSLQGYKVKVIEKNHRAVGASIRNFGMVWPIGQPSGVLYETAKRSAAIWQEICGGAGFFCDPVGSLHLAYEKDEANVLEELYEVYKKERPIEVLKPEQLVERSGAVVRHDLVSGLFSADEVIIDPREVIGSLPVYFQEKFGIQFIWGQSVVEVHQGAVCTAEEKYSANVIVICSGVDYESLYPSVFSEHKATRCKLQMLRYAVQPGGWRIGPALCGGLSLIHYQSFRAAASLEDLRKRYDDEMPEYLKWGIHVMVSQNGRGELTIGDSHEYGNTHDPFDKSFINDLIQRYLSKFARFRNDELIETWNGMYTKLTDGSPYFFRNPEPGVYVFNGLGGAGMTLSFGLAEKLVYQI